MTLLVATLLLFAAGPFVMWPLIRTPDDPTDPTDRDREDGLGR